VIASGVVRGRLALVRAGLWARSGPAAPGARRLRVRSGAVSLVVSILLAAALALAMKIAFQGIRDSGLGEDAARTLLAWLFTATLTGALVFDLHQALAVLVAAPDLDLLRAAPLTSRALATLRMLDALPHSLPLVLTLALPAALGFAGAYGAPAAGPWGLALALAALWLPSLGVGLAFALPLARLLPPARARDLLGLLATFALIAAWLVNALLVPRIGLEALAPGAARDALASPPAWLPSVWAAGALATRPVGTALLARLALASLAGLALAWWSTLRHLDAALDRTQDAPRRVPARSGRRVARSWPAAFLARDASLFGRQWTVAADVITASLLWMLLPLLSLSLFPAGDVALARAMLTLLAVGIGYEVGARALALERGGLAWAHLSPLGCSRWVLGRLAGVGLLAVAILLPAGAAVALGFRLPPAVLPDLAERTLCAAAISISLGLLTGAAFADTGWNHPRAMLSLPGRLAGTLLLLLQIGAWLWFDASGIQLPDGLMLLVGLAASAGFVGIAGRALARRTL
jgi:hypothetical protein